MKDLIENKDGMSIVLKQKLPPQSKLFCDKIEYLHDRGKFEDKPIFDHHLMFYLKGDLVFKVWLRNKASDKEYEDIYHALKAAGFILLDETHKPERADSSPKLEKLILERILPIGYICILAFLLLVILPIAAIQMAKTYSAEKALKNWEGLGENEKFCCLELIDKKTAVAEVCEVKGG